MKLPDYTQPFADKIIRMAWKDRTTFEEIEKKTDFTEAQVIALMRRELKPSSFRMWRKRVTGRITKHRSLFEKSRLSSGFESEE
jgi:uncharacterized protein (TIGR03643 family)